MNPFYHLPTLLKWTIAIGLFLLSIAIMINWSNAVSNHLIYALLLFIAVPIFQFLTTPIMTLLGVYRYLSPMLLVFAASPKKYDLHNGTSFDYLFLMTKHKPGIQWRYIMLRYYVEGLLEIIKRLEENELPNTIEIRGSSYFFSEKTAQRIGFELSPTNSGEKLNLIVNYLDLFWTYSLAHGKFSFPNLGNIKTASISGADLLKSKDQLKRLSVFLSRNEND